MLRKLTLFLAKSGHRQGSLPVEDRAIRLIRLCLCQIKIGGRRYEDSAMTRVLRHCRLIRSVILTRTTTDPIYRIIFLGHQELLAAVRMNALVDHVSVEDLIRGYRVRRAYHSVVAHGSEAHNLQSTALILVQGPFLEL